MAVSLATITLCAVEACGRPELSNGLCSAHYQRQRTAQRLHLINHPLPPQCEVEGCDATPRNRQNGVAMCNTHGMRWRHHGTTELMGRAGPKAKSRCTVKGCAAVVRSSGSLHCEMHYTRLRRTGTTDTRQPVGPRLTDNGYMARFCKGHPIAAKGGVLYEHREVLYEAIGAGSHKCHWCSIRIEWKAAGKHKLVVDHLDGNKANNVVANLKPSCHRCNSARGAFQAWVMLHRDDPFLWSMYEAARLAA